MNVTSQMSVEEFTQVFDKYSPWVIFAGSAVSRNSPSNIPFARDLIEHLASDLKLSLSGIKNCQRLVTRLADSRTEEGHDYYSLRFEILMNVVNEVLTYCGVDMLEEGIRPIFQGVAPNASHKVIAKLVQQGLVKHVVTTNYDHLIEMALIQDGIKPNIFSLPEQFEKIPTNIGTLTTPHVFKIHGSVDSPLSMQFFMPQVNQRLSEQVEALLSSLMSKYSTLIVGYSGEDYDIRPMFASSRPLALFRSIVPNRDHFHFKGEVDISSDLNSVKPGQTTNANIFTWIARTHSLRLRDTSGVNVSFEPFGMPRLAPFVNFLNRLPIGYKLLILGAIYRHLQYKQSVWAFESAADVLPHHLRGLALQRMAAGGLGNRHVIAARMNGTIEKLGKLTPSIQALVSRSLSTNYLQIGALEEGISR